MLHQRWEYRVAEQRISSTEETDAWEVGRDGLEFQLNDLGKQGWELVSVVYPVVLGGDQWALLTLKRPIGWQPA